MIKSTIGMIRTMWIMIGISFVMLLMLDSLAGVILSRTRPPSVFEASLQAESYAGANWVKSYFESFVRIYSKAEWRTYVYWKMPQFTSEYLNIDDNGLRKSWNPEAVRSGAATARKVFLFGGSTMWGIGARDEFTIPSAFSKLVASDMGKKMSQNYVVTNFGQIGFLSGQEVIVLEEELKKGNIPHLVIFYDGFNDTASALLYGKAGLPLFEDRRAAEFNLLRPDNTRKLAFAALRQLAVTSSIFGLMNPRENVIDRPKLARDETGSKALAKATVDNYMSNIRHVNRLSKAYGFQCAYFWQPTIYTKKKLTAFEATFLDKTPEGNVDTDHVLHGFFDQVTEAIRSVDLKDDLPFKNIDDVFRDESGPRYVDMVHLADLGNEAIAKAMYAQVMPLLSR